MEKAKEFSWIRELEIRELEDWEEIGKSKGPPQHRTGGYIKVFLAFAPSAGGTVVIMTPTNKENPVCGIPALG